MTRIARISLAKERLRKAIRVIRAIRGCFFRFYGVNKYNLLNHLDGKRRWRLIAGDDFFDGTYQLI